MYVCMLRVRLGLVLGRHPKINLFGLHYCVICCEVETKYVECCIHSNQALPDTEMEKLCLKCFCVLALFSLTYNTLNS